MSFVGLTSKHKRSAELLAATYNWSLKQEAYPMSSKPPSVRSSIKSLKLGIFYSEREREELAAFKSHFSDVEISIPQQQKRKNERSEPEQPATLLSLGQQYILCAAKSLEKQDKRRNAPLKVRSYSCV